MYKKVRQIASMRIICARIIYVLRERKSFLPVYGTTFTASIDLPTVLCASKVTIFNFQSERMNSLSNPLYFFLLSIVPSLSLSFFFPLYFSLFLSPNSDELFCAIALYDVHSFYCSTVQSSAFGRLVFNVQPHFDMALKTEISNIQWRYRLWLYLA